MKMQTWIVVLLAASACTSGPADSTASPILAATSTPATAGPRATVSATATSTSRPTATMTATPVATSTTGPHLVSCDDLLDPAHGRVALTLGNGTTNGVATVNADGSDLRMIVEPGDSRSQPHAGTESPRWTADGSLVFSSNRAGGPDDWHLFRVTADGEELRQLTDGSEAIEYQPSVSTDGSTIAFGKAVASPDAPDPYREAGIFLSDADGFNERQLTTAPPGAVDERPDISPDGDRLAFSRFNDDGGAVFVVNIDGTGLSQLTDFAIQAYRPRWSPDGSLIAFSSNADAFGATSANVWVVVPDGSGMRQVTHVSKGDQAWAPDWAPDGTHLVFVHGGDLDVLDLEGGQTCTLVRSRPAMFPGDPDWGPMPIRAGRDRGGIRCQVRRTSGDELPGPGTELTEATVPSPCRSLT